LYNRITKLQNNNYVRFFYITFCPTEISKYFELYLKDLRWTDIKYLREVKKEYRVVKQKTSPLNNTNRKSTCSNSARD